MDHATVHYKLVVRAELARRGWGYVDLYNEMKRRFPRMDLKSSESINLFLGKKGTPPKASNVRFMTEMNKVLGFAPPPRCDPSDEVSQLQDRLAAKWPLLTPRERALVLQMFADEPES